MREMNRGPHDPLRQQRERQAEAEKKATAKKPAAKKKSTKKAAPVVEADEPQQDTASAEGEES